MKYKGTLVSGKPEEKLNAGLKAPEDIIKIVQNYYEVNCIFANIPWASDNGFIKKVLRKFYKFCFILKCISKHFLIIQNNFFVPFLINKYVVIIHDLTGLRFKMSDIERKELRFLKKAQCVISHNSAMTYYLVSMGIDKSKIVNLELFDYLCDEVDYKEMKINSALIVAYAGNLDKAPFLTQLQDEKMNFYLRLYGVSEKLIFSEKIEYAGKTQPDKLPSMIDADLGLVWDGNIDSSDEKDLLKNYTKYNNPHKVSCYLAAGIPVVVWSKSAISQFVKEYNCGYCIENIYDLNSLDLYDYETKKKNAIELSKKVRVGYFTKKALDKAFQISGVKIKEK